MPAGKIIRTDQKGHHIVDPVTGGRKVILSGGYESKVNIGNNVSYTVKGSKGDFFVANFDGFHYDDPVAEKLAHLFTSPQSHMEPWMGPLSFSQLEEVLSNAETTNAIGAIIFEPQQEWPYQFMAIGMTHDARKKAEDYLFDKGFGGGGSETSPYMGTNRYEGQIMDIVKDFRPFALKKSKRDGIAFIPVDGLSSKRGNSTHYDHLIGAVELIKLGTH